MGRIDCRNAFSNRLQGTRITGGNFMCGIVGYVGDEQAAPILLAGLSKLEYRVMPQALAA